MKFSYDPHLRRMAILARPLISAHTPTLQGAKKIRERYATARRRARLHGGPQVTLVLAQLDRYHSVAADGTIYYRTGGGALVPLT